MWTSVVVLEMYFYCKIDPVVFAKEAQPYTDNESLFSGRRGDSSPKRV